MQSRADCLYASHMLMERALDTHRLFLQDAHTVFLSFKPMSPKQSAWVCWPKFCMQFYFLHVCCMFHLFHPACNHPNNSIRLYGSMTMNVGWESRLWHLCQLPWNSVVHQLLMDLCFCLTHLCTSMIILQIHLVKWKKQARNCTERCTLQFWALIVKSLLKMFHAFDYKTYRNNNIKKFKCSICIINLHCLCLVQV